MCPPIRLVFVCFASRPTDSKQETIPPPEIAHFEKRLKSFLKSPKAQRWCLYEWFYSPIDAILLKDNPFQTCLEELGLDRVTKKNKNKKTTAHQPPATLFSTHLSIPSTLLAL